MTQTILVTGGAGFIGSHTAVVLLEAGFDVIVVDDLSNSSQEALGRVEAIVGRKPGFHEFDLRDEGRLGRLLDEHHVDAVIHFAGKKAVGESAEVPLAYYHNNIASTLVLLEAMKQHDIYNLVFSSSATVYGETNRAPFLEDMPLAATNPYGRTKLFIEKILEDLAVTDERWRLVALRYFNPAGAHPSGTIGEDPDGIPNNLMPFVSQVALGRLDRLRIFGDDYETPDGTCIRDYIHVVDLAQGHLAALRALPELQRFSAYNLGRGQGQSVFEVVRAFERAAGREIPYEVAGRRRGDVKESYANVDRATADLDWHARLTLEDMCEDAWRWQQANPQGYGR